MAWQDTLNDLRDELADVRVRRLQRAEANEAELAKVRQEITELAQSLGIGQLLAEMNATLLQGKGEIDTIISWDEDTEPDDGLDGEASLNELPDEEEDEDEETISTILSWDEDGDREIAVEVVLDEDGISLQVNGVEIRPEVEALQQGLVEAFRDELEL